MFYASILLQEIFADEKKMCEEFCSITNVGVLQ